VRYYCVILRLAVLTIPECDRHTQKDRQTHDDGIYRASISSRGKKCGDQGKGGAKILKVVGFFDPHFA